MPVHIQTARLVLRSLVEDDVANIFLQERNPDVQRFTGQAVAGSLTEAASTVSRAIDYGNRYPGLGVFANLERSTGAFVGTCALKHVGPLAELASAESDARPIEVGYRYLPAHWGRGFATEATEALLVHGHQTVGLNRIIAIADPENGASIRVMEKAGMADEGTLLFDGETVRMFASRRGE